MLPSMVIIVKAGANLDWENLFAASSRKLQATLDEARAALQHRGLKGAVNEKAFADAIQGYIPSSIGVCTGEIIDSNGGQSRQVDVLLFDQATTPRIFARDDINVLPIEAVYAAIEVKTHLNKAAIEDAFENMKSIKTLDRTAYHPNRALTNKMLYDMPSEHWRIQFFIFAYESDNLDTVLEHVERLNATQPIDKRIDMVCVLDKGLVINLSPEGLQPMPLAHTKLIAKPSSKSLLTFYALLIHLLGQATNEPIAMHRYLARIQH